jgi:hypothetical protein
MFTERVSSFIIVLAVLLAAPQAQAQAPPEINIKDTVRASAVPNNNRGGAGVPVDAQGGPTVDPTKNVLDLVEAAIRRQDDLRHALSVLTQTQIKSQEKISEIRYSHAQDLAMAQAKQLESEAKLRSEYAERLAIAEAKRIDAIRAVDVNAVAVANQRTSEQATALQVQTTASAEVLRNQVSRSAEDLRALVATTAATQLANQSQQFAGITSQITALSGRITTLEQSGATATGRQLPQDPVIAALVSEVRNLAQSRTAVQATGEGQSNVIAWIIAVMGGIFGLIGAVAAIIIVMRGQKSYEPSGGARSAA